SPNWKWLAPEAESVAFLADLLNFTWSAPLATNFTFLASIDPSRWHAPERVPSKSADAFAWSFIWHAPLATSFTFLASIDPSKWLAPERVALKSLVDLKSLKVILEAEVRCTLWRAGMVICAVKGCLVVQDRFFSMVNFSIWPSLSTLGISSKLSSPVITT